MKRISLKNTLLLFLIVSIFSVVLTGCIEIIVPENVGTVKVVLTGNRNYNILVDGMTKLTNKPSGTYTISNITPGTRTIEAIDTMGESFGYDSVTVNIAPGTIKPVYLNPSATIAAGKVYIELSGPFSYDIKMDGITKFFSKPSGSYVLNNVSVGNHFFEAVDDISPSIGYDSKTQYIHTGTNKVYLTIH